MIIIYKQNNNNNLYSYSKYAYKNTTYNSNGNKSIYMPTYYEAKQYLINLYRVFLVYHLILNEKLY